MVWGKQNQQGVDDLVARLAKNDSGLRSLTIMRNRKCGTEEIATLCQALASNTILTELSISSHAVEPAGCAAIASLLATNSSLQSVSIGNSSLGDAALIELCPGVAASGSLTHLDLENRNITAEGAGALARALTSSSLASLNLSRNERLGPQGLTALCAPPGWSCVKTLDLGGCGLTSLSGQPEEAAGGDGAAVNALTSPGAPLTHVHVLRLGHNALGPDAAPQLASLLQHAPAFKELHLSHTQLGDEGVVQLAGALTNAPALTVLDLEATGLGDAAVLALAAALKSGCPSLRSLSLAGNTAVTDKAVQALAESAAQRQPGAAVTSLDISSTQVSESGLRALAALPGLQKLSLFSCSLGSAGTETLCQLLAPVPLAQEGSSNGTTGSASGASASASAGFASLVDLVVSACGFGMAAAVQLLQALAAGGAPALTSMEIGANAACQDAAFGEEVERLRAARPQLSVHWRNGDIQQQPPQM